MIESLAQTSFLYRLLEGALASALSRHGLFRHHHTQHIGIVIN